VVEALNHAAIHHGTGLEVIWVDAETLSKQEAERKLEEADGVLIPGGFGIRGIEGKIAAARFARENGVPYFGICLGMQVAVVELIERPDHPWYVASQYHPEFKSRPNRPQPLFRDFIGAAVARRSAPAAATQNAVA